MNIRKLAELAGVSVGTASNALNGRGRVAEKTRQKVLKVAREMGYDQDPLLATTLGRLRRKSAARGAVGVFLGSQRPSAEVMETLDCVEGVKSVLEPHGYALDLIYPDKEAGASFSRQIQILKARGWMGLIFVEPIFTVYSAVLENLSGDSYQPLPVEVPVVYAGRGFASSGPTFQVTYDRHAAGFSCMEKAFERGYRRPLILQIFSRRQSAREGFAAGCLQAQQMFFPQSEWIPVVRSDILSTEGLPEIVKDHAADCLLLNAPLRDIKEFARVFPVFHGEADLTERLCGMCADWKTIGAASAQLLLELISAPKAGRQGKGRRVLIPGDWKEPKNDLLHTAPLTEHGRLVYTSLEPWVNCIVNNPRDWFGGYPLPLSSERSLHGTGDLFTLTRQGESSGIGGVLLKSLRKETKDSPRELRLPAPAGKIKKVHLLVACAFAEPGARPAICELLSAKGRVLDRLELNSGGRPKPHPDANIQDWWEHFPLVHGAVPIYDSSDRLYRGYAYRFSRNPSPKAHLVTELRLFSPGNIETSVCLLAATFEMA